MRVLLVTPATPPLVGGLERIAANVAHGLMASGHEAAIVGQFASAHHPLRGRFTRGEEERSFRVDGIPVSIVRPRWPAGLPGAAVYAMMPVVVADVPALRESVGERGRALAAGHTHERALASHVDAYADAVRRRQEPEW